MLSILDIVMWCVAGLFTILIFRELRRVRAILATNAALARARKDVERAHRLYQDKTTLDEV